jgi:hypothetical protein
MFDVIIPCKSNFDGLQGLVASLVNDPGTREIVVVADGQNAYDRIESFDLPVTLLSVPLASGIHKMWNLGMDAIQGNNRHLAIINDDVSLSDNAISTVVKMLDADPAKGLVTPSQNADDRFEFVETTAFAGYCMVIAKDLVSEWRFDERMMWWYGDNDVIMWVRHTKNRITGLTALCYALGNHSHTIYYDPPPNFNTDIERDSEIYKTKWP